MTHQSIYQREAIAYHGWGFDSTCWGCWKAWLHQWHISLQCFDRGYFGPPVNPSFSPTATTKILLVHSFGLHLCPVEQIKQADWLLIFSSFRAFHPVPHRARRRSHAVLTQMMQQIQTQPKHVLQQFKVNCYHPQSCPDVEVNTLNGDRLLADLQALDCVSLEPLPLSKKTHVVLFHGVCDQIVAPDLGQALMGCFPAASQFVEVPNAGHALPFSHAADCWAVLDPLFKPPVMS
jgi:pimeloyl-[acyl-carrier protein] methyl ester esterase